ncbi:MAG TPA: xanthine dehydrogenase small subunit, partial [Casimicrobiaceae bacterium]|nr:xanthine dehydrogenase small subunit [Casimicrobiaceae bacterium]
ARIAAARIGCGGVAPVPRRAYHCEGALAGRPWNGETVALGAAALEHDFTPISDMRGSAAYRIAVLKNLLRRFHLETTQPSIATRAVEFVAS